MSSSDEHWLSASHHVGTQRLREYLLSSDRESRVQRELWRCNNGAYLAYRMYLSTVRQVSTGPAAHHASSASAAAANAAAAQMGSVTKYTFHGMRYVFDECRTAVTTIAFAQVRSDWLAFASVDGELWFAELGEDDNVPPVLHKAPKIHALAILCLDWSFDNSQLLTTGEDSAICIWDTANRSCIRSIALREGPIHCCRFHTLNPNLAILGMSTGRLEVFNCSTGTLQLKVPVASAFQAALSVTALEVSNHHVFVGDSAGWLHVFSHEKSKDVNQSHTLRRRSKFRLHTPTTPAAVTSPSKVAVVQIQYIPFCRATDTPILLVSSRDSTITLLRVHEKNGTVDIQRQCATPPMARDIRAAVCPLSVIQDIPRVVMGGEDTNVYIYNVAGGAPKPVVVNTLKGHHAPVSDVSWAFDESLLATADCAGMVIVWKRAS